MAERVPALISAVLQDGDFDVEEPAALRWLSDGHKLLVKRSKCYRKRIALGETVASQGTYGAGLLDEVVEVVEVLVGGLPYGRGRHSDIAASAQGWLLLGGMGGVTVEDESTGGGYEIALVPAPVEGGAAIEVYAVCRAPALLAADDTTLKIPSEYDPALVNYAFSVGLQRDEGRPELSRPYREEFEASCTELRREVAIRNAPRRARVSGYNV